MYAIALPTIELSTLARFFLKIVFGFTIISIILTLLPTGTLPSGIATSISWTTQQLVNFDFMLPTETILTIIAYIIIIEAVLFSAKVVRWVAGILSVSPIGFSDS